jgi:hypothetical protein
LSPPDKPNSLSSTIPRYPVDVELRIVELISDLLIRTVNNQVPAGYQQETLPV